MIIFCVIERGSLFSFPWRLAIGEQEKEKRKKWPNKDTYFQFFNEQTRFTFIESGLI